MESLATRLYQALQLFVLESGPVSGALPWELELARFAAPVTSAYALVRLLAAVFHDRVERLRARRLRDHVAVAGLGRTGGLLVEALLRGGRRVIVIELDPMNPGLASVRALGGLIVAGDARRPEVLRSAGVERARQLVVLCGTDAINIEVVARAREVVRSRRGGSLHAVVQVDEPHLAQLLCLEELERYAEAPIRVDFVNVPVAATQALLRAHPPFEPSVGASPTVGVVGNGPTARHLLPALARARASRGDEDRIGRLRLVVAGWAADALVSLRRAHPELEEFVELSPVNDLAGIAGREPATVYVCPDDDQAAAINALELRALMAGHSATIVVVLERRAGLGSLLDGSHGITGGPNLVTFESLAEACQPDVLLAGTTELLARAIHAAYLDAAVPSAGRPDDPALRTWHDLPESLKDSSRDQAAHVAVKLAAVGHAVGPLLDWDAARRPFSDPDIEVMARLEHDRWVEERKRAGWTPGPRDPDRRTTPYLVRWEELPEDVRDKDRLFVRQLPSLLASVGLQAIPRPERPRPAYGP